MDTICVSVSNVFLLDRRPGEDSGGDFRDSSSDGSSDCEHDRGCMSYVREQHPSGKVPSTMAHLSLQHQEIEFQEGFSSDEGEYGSSQGSLLFEYLERDPPFSREPLASKVSHFFRLLPPIFLLGVWFCFTVFICIFGLGNGMKLWELLEGERTFYFHNGFFIYCDRYLTLLFGFLS